MMHTHSDQHEHHHHQVSEKTVNCLTLSFAINMVLSIVEFAGGIVAGSVSLIGDALHNTSDAFSILIAVIAFKIGHKKATPKYTYGFKRAEVIGGFVNLILLFISGVYLLAEGGMRLFYPEPIEGRLIIVISVLALLVDALTAKLSHHHAHHSSNMKMVFVHNLADAFGSVGVIVSGVCVVAFGVYFVDGIVALMIAFYMIFQAVFSFKPIVRILMNAAPENVDLRKVKQAIENVKGVENVHHIHLWCVSEHEVSLECHVRGTDLALVAQICKLLDDEFGICHANIQLEDTKDCPECGL